MCVTQPPSVKGVVRFVCTEICKYLDKFVNVHKNMDLQYLHSLSILLQELQVLS